MARIEYLSSADERLEWINNGIPKDDLCMENVIMLHRFNRYPLIIDPSGQCLEYLMKQYPSIQKTSFLDNSFRYVRIFYVLKIVVFLQEEFGVCAAFRINAFGTGC